MTRAVPRQRRVQPGPQVAVAVGLEVEPARARRLREPLAAVGIRAGPGEPLVAARCASTDVRELGQKRDDAHVVLLAFAHGNANAHPVGDLFRDLVAGIDVPDDAHRGIVREHARELLGGQRACRPRP